MLAWIDIDNPPQVQYMAPFIEAFERRGLEVLVTARDYGFTTDCSSARDQHRGLGGEFGASRVASARDPGRALARIGRARRLPGFAVEHVAISRDRCGMGVPSFMILDYEHAELASFRAAGTTVLHPD